MRICFSFQTRAFGGRPEQGLAARVVRDLTGTLEGDNHEVYMDNFFSSVALFEERLQKSVLCCGTLRTNRKGCPEVLKGKKVVRKHGESNAYNITMGTILLSCLLRTRSGTCHDIMLLYLLRLQYYF